MATPQNVSVDQMRQILTEVLDTLDSPSYAHKLDEAKEAAGNEMLKMMQIVFPMVVQIQMEIIKRHGFSNSREEALIAAVSEQRLLWDKKHKHYRNRLLVQRSWKNVAEAVECTADDVKKKWKNLRDSYNRELKKVEKPRSGQYQGDWPHFESMQFLKTILKPRKTTSNIQNNILDENDIIDDDTMMSILSEQSAYNTQTDESQFNTDDTNLATIDGPTTDAATSQNAISAQILHDTSTPEPSYTPSHRIHIGTLANQKVQEGAAKSIEEILITLEREKIDLMKKNLNEDDDDLNWFKSIMPYMKKLPSLNKLLFRTQVQEMLINEMSKLNTPSNTESSMMGYFTSGDSSQ